MHHFPSKTKATLSLGHMYMCDRRWCKSEKLYNIHSFSTFIWTQNEFQKVNGPECQNQKTSGLSTYRLWIPVHHGRVLSVHQLNVSLCAQNSCGLDGGKVLGQTGIKGCVRFLWQLRLRRFVIDNSQRRGQEVKALVEKSSKLQETDFKTGTDQGFYPAAIH